MRETQKENPFALLKDRTILNILDGDTPFGNVEQVECDEPLHIVMPYLSGPTLCDISNKVGLPSSYTWGGAKSRWEYLSDTLDYCIENSKVDKLLKILFAKAQFRSYFKGLTVEQIDKVHTEICNKIIEQINAELLYSEYELVRLGENFTIRKIGTNVHIETPCVQAVDRTYISTLSERALSDIENGNYDSAVTKARTLLEEVFCFVIEKKGEEVSSKGDIAKLYNQVKSLYSMHQVHDADVRINSLLSGLEKILTAISEMRNTNSDAHGVGKRRFTIKDHHARLFVNSATIMAEFILAVSENQNVGS